MRGWLTSVGIAALMSGAVVTGCSGSSSSGSPSTSPDASVDSSLPEAAADTSLADARPPEAGADAQPSEAGGDATASDAGLDSTVADGAADASSQDAGDASTESGVVVIVGNAAATAAVSGTVRDGTTGATIAGATVTVGTASAQTDATGAFQLVAPTGLQTLAVAATGYVARSQPLGVAELPSWQPVTLAPQAAPQTVSASGGTVTAGSMTLQFPAGAYASTTSVVASAFDGLAVTASSGPIRYVDASGTSWEVLEALDVQVPSEPALPVTMTAPVPPGTSAADIALVDLVNGAWTSPIAPTSVSGGWATFSVAHFSDPGVVWKTAPGTARFLTVSGGVGYNSGAGANSARVGDKCDAPCTFLTAIDGYADIAFDDGTVLRVTPSTQVQFTSEQPGFIIQMTMAWGHIKATVAHLAKPHFSVWGPGQSVAGVRGTVFDFTAASCGADFEDIIACTDGDVDVTSGGTDTDDPAGKKVTLWGPGCAAIGGDAGVDASPDAAADGGDCISGTWLIDYPNTPCGTTTTMMTVTSNGPGYDVEFTLDNATQYWWTDGGGYCGPSTATATNGTWDGTSLTFTYAVPASSEQCPTVTNTTTITPDATCQSAATSYVSNGCGTCTNWGCNTCGSNTCPAPNGNQAASKQ